MHRYLYLLLTLMLSSHLYGQTIGVEDNTIMLGVRDSLGSEVLGEERSIWVYVPASAVDTEKRYPVLILLDGNAHFYSVSGMLRQLAEVNGNTISPETIVVAIPNTNRVRDLTPSAVSYFPNSGGADKFAAFIEDELIPYIDKKYPTTTYRTLVGHSWGALFVLNTLIKHPGLFENYISLDPGIRYNNQQFLNELKAAFTRSSFEGKSLFLAVANRLPEGLDLNTVTSDSSKSSEHMRKMLEFVAAAEEADALNFGWKFYPDDQHLTVPLIGTYDAIRFLFPWYSFNEEVLFNGSIDMNGEEFVDFVKAHFQNISEHFGYQVLPAENLVNRLGDISLSERDYEKAYALFDMNMQHYPESARVYEAMGDYYRSQNDTEKAKSFYQQSLDKSETARARRKLERLQ